MDHAEPRDGGLVGRALFALLMVLVLPLYFAVTIPMAAFTTRLERQSMITGGPGPHAVPMWKRVRREVRRNSRWYWGRHTLRSWGRPGDSWTATPEAMQGDVRLNVGCGRTILPGFLNLDQYPHPGASKGVLVMGGLPLPNAAADYILADAVLEHVLDFGAAMHEVHRVLKPGGILEATVPYRVDNYNPYHVRRFTERSLWAVLGPGATLEGQPDGWTLLHVGITRRGFPSPQLQEHLGLNLPVGRRLELTFVLRKT